jgi:HD-GYP domain-containing protein (c-di-GMP phosphodiesterase class II)
MIDRRPYQEPRTPEAAIAELRRCAGTQFDPDVVTALVAVLDASAQALAPAEAALS